MVETGETSINRHVSDLIAPLVLINTFEGGHHSFDVGQGRLGGQGEVSRGGAGNVMATDGERERSGEEVLSETVSSARKCRMSPLILRLSSNRHPALKG